MRILAVLLLAGCAAPTPPPAPAPPPEPSYAIQLHRPARIGETRRLRTTATSLQSLVVTSGEAVLRQQVDQVQVIFAGTEKVLDVTDGGTPTRSEYTVTEAFADTPAEGREELLPAGAILTVTRGVEAPFALRDGSLSPEAERRLALVFSTSPPVRTDDDIFGTTTPQKVGATWPLRAEAAARDLAETGLGMDGAVVSGETELEAIETVGGVECLRIAARLTADQVTPPGLEPGETVEKARFEAHFAGAYPTDASKRRLSDESEVTAEFAILRSVDGRPVRTEMSMKRALETTYD